MCNLRALEMFDKDSIMFSTANPDRRYIKMRQVKVSNNLRDTYLRGITLGGQDEVIYEETDSLRIARHLERQVERYRMNEKKKREQNHLQSRFFIVCES